MPKGFTHHCVNIHQAINLFQDLKSGVFNQVEYISFDHDLGEKQDTGYDLATWIEKKVYLGKMKPPRWSIHSANPVGRKRIKAAMIAANRFYNFKEGKMV